ncbi:MAG: sigma-70 family RNA polymerase sigma factor [Planctomycetes bacterium]|nr:sigma-70 family RNA polymerase sigma factor [Planctomycetota bacterium]
MTTRTEFWSTSVLPPDAGSSQTNWTMIFTVGGEDNSASEKALELLARRYWPAVYAYIRNKGRDVHEASDLTQGFVCDVMLGRKLFHEADPKRGRFRTLLLTSLQNYLRERHRYVTRKKRSHQGMQPMSLSETETNLIHLAKDVSPEAAFNSAWSVTLVREVLEQARRACIADGFEAHWVVFEQRVVRPMLFGEKPASYKSLVERLDLDDRSQAANMMITVKRRFARMMLTETGRTMSRPEKALSEIKDILKDLEKTT